MHLFGYLHKIIMVGMTTCCVHDYSGMNMRERKCPVQISAGIDINTSKTKPRTKKRLLKHQNKDGHIQIHDPLLQNQNTAKLQDSLHNFNYSFCNQNGFEKPMITYCYSKCSTREEEVKEGSQQFQGCKCINVADIKRLD